jgi:hypothetical protein
MWRRVAGLAGLGAVLAWSPVSCERSATRCECGAPPRCGEVCQAACGCCRVGPSSCAPEGIVRTDQSLNCYAELIPCSAMNRCVPAIGGPMCAESVDDCEAVRAAYEAHLHSAGPTTLRTGSGPLPTGLYRNLQCPDGCRVSAGHCAQGLDTCWFLSYGPDPELDRLAALYETLGCPTLGPCSCPPAPEATCQFDNSGAAGAHRGPLTCTVQ